MAFFHRPDKGKYRRRTVPHTVFHRLGMVGKFPRQGLLSLADDLTPQINNEAGVQALEELIAASKPTLSRCSNEWPVREFRSFGEGDKFANIGWGGTQKFLNSDKSKIKG